MTAAKNSYSDVIVELTMSSRHVDLSKARRLAVTSSKLSGSRSSSAFPKQNILAVSLLVGPLNNS